MGWYVLYTKPRHEKKVFERLSELRIEAFLPMQKSAVGNSKGSRRFTIPLFPSYVFIYLKNTKDYLDAMQVEGVFTFVRFGKEMAMLKDSVISELKLIVDKCEDLQVSGEVFNAGQKLVIHNGPLAGLSCECIQYFGEKKILVRVNLLN